MTTEKTYTLTESQLMNIFNDLINTEDCKKELRTYFMMETLQNALKPAMKKFNELTKDKLESELKAGDVMYLKENSN